MFEINRRQFILKQSSGKTLNIFYKESAGICISTLNKKGIWNTPTIIMRNTVPEFYTYMDSNNCIHILCQDRNGSITYLNYDNTDWKSTPLITGRSAIHGLRQLWVGGYGKNIYLLYTADYPGSSFLYYQAGSTHGDLLEPNVLDCIKDGMPSFRPVADSNGNLSVFYVQKTETNKALGFRTCSSSTGIWSDFIPFREETVKVKLQVISAYFDTANNLHLLWNESEGTNNILCCSARYNGETGWRREENIAASDLPFVNSSFAGEGKLIAVYWIAENTIYYRISSDSGCTWSEKAEYFMPQGKHIYCMSFSSNDPDGQVTSLCLPGSYTDGYKLAFLNDMKILEGGMTKVPAAQADTINGNGPAAAISGSYAGRPGSSYAELVEQIENLNIRQSLLEAGMAKLKADFGVLEALVKAMDKAAEAASRRTPAEAPAEPSLMPQAPKGIPLMPGSGFSFVTPEYLKSLKKQT